MERKISIVGAGPAGLTIARELADRGDSVTIYEKRDHIGGNCYDCHDEHGVLIHPYGPHFFRSDSRRLIAWLSRFTQWRPAEYIVKAMVDNELIPLPVNFNTLTQLTGEPFDRPKLKEYLKKHVQKNRKPKNAKEQCLAKVGSELYKSIFENYTRKQWGVGASELSPSVTARIPIRYNYDNRYPEEEFQIIPRDGYTAMFIKMVEHPNIRIELNCELHEDGLKKLKNDSDLLFYTGPIDHFFGHRFGKLEYRSLNFQWKNFPMYYYQSCASINYPNDYDYTRSVEVKHITGQLSDSTSVCFEYPKSKGEPFYPILSPPNKTLLAKYFELVNQQHNVHFVGRLAEYKYYNMDHVFLRALDLTGKL